MIHFLKRKWQTLKKGSIVISIGSIVIVTLGVNLAIIAHKETVKKNIVLKTTRAEIPLVVSVAASPREQALGLMGTKLLKDGEGMLFIFDRPKQVGFWMKNMKIPLDMLFIGEDRKINHIAENVPPCPKQGLCPTVGSPTPVHYVLEVPTGYAKRNAIGIGDQLIQP